LATAAYKPQKGETEVCCCAEKKRPRIGMIRKGINQQLGHLKRNLASTEALIAFGGCLLAAGHHVY